jgi:NitT/TauT family transport system ATP-binding protein
LDGEPVTTPRPDVAMVFQHFGLFPWKNLEENISYGLALRGEARQEIAQRVERYIELVGLRGFEKSYPYQLSGGMQQRAGLARALAVNPSLLLMDEPFGSLDAQTRETLQEELSKILQQERKTMLFVTHSIDEAIYLGDRILLMTPRPGRIREILGVKIPRPRDISRVRSDPQSIQLRNYIWEQLKQHADNS